MYAVDVVHLLGLCVIRLEIVIADRPGRRDAILFAKLTEVFTAQPIERSAIHLGGAPDKVVNLWLEWSALAVEPGVGRDISVVDKHRFGIPVQCLAFQPVTALENQDAFSGRGEGA